MSYSLDHAECRGSIDTTGTSGMCQSNQPMGRKPTSVKNARLLMSFACLLDCCCGEYTTSERSSQNVTPRLVAGRKTYTSSGSLPTQMEFIEMRCCHCPGKFHIVYFWNSYFSHSSSHYILLVLRFRASRETCQRVRVVHPYPCGHQR